MKCREAKELGAFFGGPFNYHLNQLCGLCDLISERKDHKDYSNG